MYETGTGVERDLFLAKRMYDLSLTTNPAGYIPVNMALFRLVLKWSWYWLKGEKVPSIFAPAPDPEADYKPKDDLYSMDEEENMTLSSQFLLLLLIGVGSLIFYWRQKLVGQVHGARHAIPTDEEMDPLIQNNEENDVR